MTRTTSRTLFTLGYQQRSVKEFVSFLIDADVSILVDVRETPWSHKPGFSKRRLAKTLSAKGIRYLHARFAGNPKTIRANATSHAECLDLYDRYLDANPQVLDALNEVVGSLLVAGERVCLMCYERHPDDCHRGVLVERWQSKSPRAVAHLGADERFRLVRA